ncbi:MBL fold metallo-hydrolase [Chengkuizengella axinellae]|uniref:MBL fold metallo-hydrolase n=1 Tax=Chengkuizengella axinellae TaxID=3064388 RepID=A0ABT9IV99_9BACL|nr:MBL fold metallo-hydrolase [Chengkuizengella sp. 2205SS18-9]MDP5273286.1 MBL fold metallo-hydrolase [Chengkuizengella sp. 2205SS18-9]
MQIQMIGTGSAFSKKYFNNNALVYTEDYTLLIDCGITAPMALHKLNKPVQEIDGILITHLHADHVGGVEELAFQSKFLNIPKPKLFISAKLLPVLWENSLKAGLSDGKGNGLEDFFEIVEMNENEETTISPSLHIEIIQTEHVPNKLSYSLFINQDLFYSADMQFNPSLLAHIHEGRKCRTIMHDCQLEDPGTVHATLNQLLTLPEEIQEKILLMHYGDHMEDFIGKTGKMTFMEQQKRYTFESNE